MVVRPLNHQNPIKKVGNQNHECIINDDIIQICRAFCATENCKQTIKTKGKNREKR